MAFPFDILDIFIPEIAQWMSGKSSSLKRRYFRAGVGLTSVGALIGMLSYAESPLVMWAWNSLLGIYIGLSFAACGVFFLLCALVDNRKNKASQ